MSVVRVVFMGTPHFAAPSLEALLGAPDRCNVVGVVTQPDRPAGRGRKLAPSPVKSRALQAGVPVETFTKLKAASTAATLRAWKPDAVVVAAYGRILPPKILEIPPCGCVNVHASLLPRHRGAAPIAHAILAGDRQTGVSIMKMEEGLDTGPVYARESIAIAPDDTAGTLASRLADLGARLLASTLPHIISGHCTPEPQDDSQATYAPMLKKEDGCLDFAQPAEVLERRIRGLAPWPGAYSCCNGVRVQILAAHVETGHAGAPGHVLCADAKGVLVGCGEGALRIDRVKPCGRSAMPAAAWVSGRGVRCGHCLTAPAPVREPAQERSAGTGK